MKSRVGALEQMEISEVVWYKPLFYWFGTIKITGIPTNIRTDQKAKKVIMIVPNLSWFYMFRFWFFVFFYGSLRYFLKQSDIKINRKYKKFKFK